MTQKCNRGFTLMELMLAMLVLVVALVSMVVSYVSLFELIETSRNITLMINSCQKQLEEIKNADFNDVDDYNNTTFTPDYLSGDSLGSVFVDSSDGELLEVRVAVCWRQKGGRIIGEDRNLNGQLGAGEDLDSDGSITSPARVITLISQ